MQQINKKIRNQIKNPLLKLREDISMIISINIHHNNHIIGWMFNGKEVSKSGVQKGGVYLQKYIEEIFFFYSVRSISRPSKLESKEKNSEASTFCILAFFFLRF